MRLAAPQRNHLSNSHGPCHRTVSVVNVLENNGKATDLGVGVIPGVGGGGGIDPKSATAVDIGSELQAINFLPRGHNHNHQYYHSHTAAAAAASHHSSHSQDSHVSSGGGGKHGSSGHVAKDGSSSSHSQEYS